jgi:Arc/MetJ-type ribon-helix-helix transcriptional regulator
MSVVVCVRIPRELRERMRRLKDVNWSDVIRRSIEETVSRYEVEEVIRRVEEDLRDVPELPPGTVSRWIRVDRESH